MNKAPIHSVPVPDLMLPRLKVYFHSQKKGEKNKL